jgi:hypothetical protein
MTTLIIAVAVVLAVAGAAPLIVAWSRSNREGSRPKDREDGQ